ARARSGASVFSNRASSAKAGRRQLWGKTGSSRVEAPASAKRRQRPFDAPQLTAGLRGNRALALARFNSGGPCCPARLQFLSAADEAACFMRRRSENREASDACGS